MKNCFATLISLVLYGFSFSQAIEIKEDVEKINGERYPGFSTKVSADVYKLENSVKMVLRDLGKMRERNTYFTITDVEIGGIEYGERNFYAEIKRSDAIHTFWFGVDTTAIVSQDWDYLSSSMKSFTYNFVIDFYKSLVQEEIDESLQAESYMVKKQKRLIKNKTDMEDELLKNKEDLIDLQNAIEENKLRHEVLVQKIKDNSFEQDSTLISLEKIRQVIKIKEQKKDSIK